MAVGALRTLALQWRRVPEDVAVVGYDDLPVAELPHSPGGRPWCADRRTRAPGRPISACGAVPRRVSVAHVLIRPENPADVDTVREVVGAAFGEHADHVLTMLDALRTDPAWVDGLSLVAVEQPEEHDADERVLGHVLLTRVEIATSRGPLPVLTLTPLAVAPDVQNRGTGTALVAAALDAASAAGWPLVLLEGDARYYGPRGFTAAEPLGLPSPSPLIPPGAWQVALLPAHEPWMTGPVTLSAPLLAVNDDPRG